ncbi:MULTISPECIES: hypothetical protein [unclassified Microcystis]|uniref:hypothetical protein n=1 Tax=unclassified Microcystis TaxID=2643300 RepID=UPI002583710F|nr:MULTISPECIES: hypothetical protein [unclassified Microcystis]
MISYQLSVISYQLSVISYQLSVISYQLSVISYQLSVTTTGRRWLKIRKILIFILLLLTIKLSDIDR